MLGRRQEINLQLTELLDSTLLAIALWLSHFLRSRILQSLFPDLEVIAPIEDFFWVMAVTIPFTPMVLEARGFYNNILNKNLRLSLRQLFETAVVMGMVIGFFVVFFRWNVGSRSVVLIALPMSGFFLLARECWQRRAIRRKLLSGGAKERVLIAGAPMDTARLLAGMSDEHRAEIHVVGVFDVTTLPIEEMTKVMREGAVSRIIFAAQHVHFSRIEEAVQACETEGVEAWISSDFFQTAIARPTFDVLGGKLMLVFHSTPQISWALCCKEVMDRLGAMLLLAMTVPLWLIAMIGIRLSSPGPVFFRQERSGRYGKPFLMWKFRTMHSDAEGQRADLEAQNEMSGPVFKIKNDPRVSAFGAFLRRSSLDELPQLLNVLRGDMSLVGPRPLPVYEIQRIEKTAQRRRLSVKPGLTCLWQISGRNRISSFEEWVELDLKYIDNWTFWLDLQILARTLPAVLRGAGAS
jgi:exopolysaccharide biosynthesis polyprenyl glycosylphosphotransferase